MSLNCKYGTWKTKNSAGCVNSNQDQEAVFVFLQGSSSLFAFKYNNKDISDVTYIVIIMPAREQLVGETKQSFV